MSGHDALVHSDPLTIFVRLDEQRLELIQAGLTLRSYSVSTAANGAGELRGSECTPRGWHRIRAKIGAGLPPLSVLVGRRPTGERYSPQLAAAHPRRDWILSRILWLSGAEPGRNRYGMVDTAWRYIYIHGSPDHLVNGRPDSHGCIRMKNADVIDLFERVPAGTPVWIG